ncbi:MULTISPECIES: aminodeoxychorismate/anthranilate synthase component II [Exiguobacterium]|uniref:Aminodeoxychorismate/anthranilate synthase component II n=1 Tax=Exiguobacterium antarcticum TaxID=132920 RepID=A0ABT6R3C9_9BACL|nr:MULTISPECIES: aminodeoxychorismate/anthranilate synthase component II [Exiguobacterium]AFS70037.1 glutamine amidotransferase of anthranilate synthase [Exiguobacterium antarcticum B7]MCT4779493.1 aminodeoxychorismate/anthranilate synthase component II [Exiguobacterium soli]MDI3235330.1 aminodeoxychorismate/anthranilate synthase component II [Exiguobacterium antarcticum]
MIVLIDNYDSFTYNLYQYAAVYDDIEVIRNDAINVQAIADLRPSGIILSPGPGNPTDAGICLDVIHAYSGKIPILGVCLGHQAIGQAFGGQVIEAPEIRHGKTSTIRQSGRLFTGLPEQLDVMRYHSLIVERTTLPDVLTITAETEDGTIMALEHREHPTYGIQFHPESIGTPDGQQMIQRFIELTKE